MSEVSNSPASNKGNWQDAIDPGFQERLMRPLVKPGVIDKAQLAGNILSRSERFANRLPLVSQLERRFSTINNLPASQVPIAYAQPLSSEANVANISTASGSSPTSGRVSRTVVQAKFAPTASKSASVSPSAIAPVRGIPVANSTKSPSSPVEVSSLPLPLVQSQNAESMQVQQNLNSIAPLTAQNTSATSTEQQNSPLPVVQSQGVEPISGLQKQESGQLERLPIVYAEPLTGEVSNLGKSSTLGNSQPLPTQVNSLPVVQPGYSQSQQTMRSQNPTTVSLTPASIPQTTGNNSQPTGETKASIPTVQVTNTVRSWLEPQSHPLPKNQTAANNLTPNQTFNQKTTIRTTNLGTPLIFSNPHSTTGQEQQANNPEFTSSQQNFERGQTNYNPANAITTVSQQISQSFNRPPVVESASSEGSNLPNNNSQAKIDVDALADKVERKLMRRLVIENERRGQTRWR